MRVSTIIVTRNRGQELKHVLGSLSSQSIKLDELIVIDNNSSDDTKIIVKNFSKNVSFPVKYFLEKTKGYPIVYNRGIKESSCDWVAFIDDDCIASPNWFSSIKKSIKKYPNSASILGKSGTFFKKNPSSLVTLIFDEFWKKSNINKNNKVLDLEVLDNKNIAYNKLFLTKNKTFFSEEIVKYYNGACEDSDLGMKIQKAGGKAYFCEEMYVEHKDPTDFIWYYKKLIFSSKSHFLYEKRWDEFRKKQKFSSNLKIKLFLKDFFNRENLSFSQKINIYFHVFVTIIISKLSKIFL
jgi:glycosyltransferase involved in cell wall biosynthesis